MASWREIERVRKDANGARALAKRLVKIHPGEFTDWESDFLQSITRYTELFEFTTRQAEKLLEIRDDTEPVTECRGFSVATIIKQCYEARLDLGEADEQWIVELHRQGSRSIRRKHLGRLMGCARELNVIEDEGHARSVISSLRRWIGAPMAVEIRQATKDGVVLGGSEPPGRREASPVISSTSAGDRFGSRTKAPSPASGRGEERGVYLTAPRSATRSSRCRPGSSAAASRRRTR